jgi:hypothetical protein
MCKIGALWTFHLIFVLEIIDLTVVTSLSAIKLGIVVEAARFVSCACNYYFIRNCNYSSILWVLQWDIIGLHRNYSTVVMQLLYLTATVKRNYLILVNWAVVGLVSIKQVCFIWTVISIPTWRWMTCSCSYILRKSSHIKEWNSVTCTFTRLFLRPAYLHFFSCMCELLCIWRYNFTLSCSRGCVGKQYLNTVINIKKSFKYLHWFFKHHGFIEDIFEMNDWSVI